MGNEKFDKAFPMGNVFANMNMSSITKVLLNASVEGRSSSIITNLIFKKNEKKKINIVLNIDPNGDEELNASAFRNIADVVQQQDSEEERSPFFLLQLIRRLYILSLFYLLLRLVTYQTTLNQHFRHYHRREDQNWLAQHGSHLR